MKIGIKRSSLLLALLFSFNTFSCDFSTIKKNTQGEYIYSRDCHIKVGQLVEENQIQTQQITLLNKSIELKDLALTSYEKRTKLWMDTTETLEQRLTSIERHKSTQNWLYFGLGIVVSGLAVYGASQLAK